MSKLAERLDRLRHTMESRDFLDGKGLSNKVNIYIFCYDPSEEMAVQHFIGQITTDQTRNSHLIECNLYKLFIDICEDMDIVGGILDMEQSEGSAFTLEQLNFSIGGNEFIAKIQETVKLYGDDILLLTGVGDVFPFMRINNLLEAMESHFDNIPILVMYPGTFDGNYVRLFDRLKPNQYYRAFNVL